METVAAFLNEPHRAVAILGGLVCVALFLYGLAANERDHR